MFLKDKLNTPIALEIYSLKDKHFKKALLSFNTTLITNYELAPLFSSIKSYSNTIKLNMDIESVSRRKAEALAKERVEKLNTFLLLVSSTEFIYHVAAGMQNALADIKNLVRDDKGRLAGSHFHKVVLSKTITDYLEAKGIDATCSIQKGTISIEDRVVINSGITHKSEFDIGFFSALGMQARSEVTTKYETQYHKCPTGSFDRATWLNMSGDTVFEHGLSTILLDSLINFIEKMINLLSIDLAAHETLQTMLDNARREFIEHEQIFEELITSREIPLDLIINHPLVKDSKALNEIDILGLGVKAKQSFYQKEAGMLLLDKIKETLGANRIVKLDPKRAEDEDMANGQYDPLHCSHIPLPDPIVRKAMLFFKKQLEDANSLISTCFDKDKLKINVSGTEYFNGNTENSVQIEFLDICIGTCRPIANENEIIRFTFKL